MPTPTTSSSHSFPNSDPLQGEAPAELTLLGRIFRSRPSLLVLRSALGFLVLFSLGCSNDGGGSKISGTSGSSIEKSDGAVADSTNVPAEKKVNVAAKSSKASTGADEAEKDVEPEKVPQDLPKKIKVSTEPDVNEPEFHDALLAAIDDYLVYGMVNSIALPAPEACAAASDSDSDAPKPMMSESEHESSHGKKLYFLFAKEIGHYVSPGGKPAPVGQVVVKEAWTSGPANPSARNLINHASGNRINPRAAVGDEVLEIGQRKNFFVMTKLAEDTPKTDQGWVYGVVDSDSKKVLASGKIASCMSCHVEAENDRLFGSKHVIGLNETIVTQVEVESPVVEPSERSENKAAEKASAPEKAAEESAPEETTPGASKEKPSKDDSSKTESAEPSAAEESDSESP